MTDYLPAIISGVIGLLGGTVGKKIYTRLTGQRMTTLQIAGKQDDQTTKWRDDALRLSDQMLQKDDDIYEALKLANQHLREKEVYERKLADCLERMEDCECKGEI